MNLNLFENLPSEIASNILSRLPVPTVACCRCVCKPWLDIVGTPEFAKSHLYKFIPVLLVYENRGLSRLCEIFEFKDDLNLEHHLFHYNLVAKFNLPNRGQIYGSVDGLLFLRDESLKPDGLFICNPVTRDCIKLNCPQEFGCSDTHVVAYGFGVSKISGEYKVVRISHERRQEGIVGQLKISIPEWQAYTLGTGSWRKIIAPPVPFYLKGGQSILESRNSGVFLNGILHWLVYDLNSHPQIICFELETETFGCLSYPLPHLAALCALGDSLCLCDTTSAREIVIWSVMERGNDNIWEKVLVIRKTRAFFRFSFMNEMLYPLKVFKDGDVLFKLDGCSFLLYYSKKYQRISFDILRSRNEATIHTPSFLSLKCFDMENVSTFDLMQFNCS